MTNPAIITLTKDTWVAVVTNVTNGVIHVTVPTTQMLQTYVDTGDPAPTTNDLAVAITSRTLEILNDVAIDVYMKAVGAAGAVRVDLV